MNILKIHVQNLNRRRENAIEGDIWIQHNEYMFPGEHWFDYPGAFLVTMSDAVIKIFTGASPQEEIYFMDGRYVIVIKSRLQQLALWDILYHTWDYNRQERREERTVEHSSSHTSVDVVQAVMAALLQVQKEARKQLWQEDEQLRRLYDNAEKLHQIIDRSGDIAISSM